MPGSSITCLHLNHLNIVVEGFEASVERFGELLGARFVADIPQDEWHAGLITVGNVLFELFSPREFLVAARYGPHYVGVEYQVPDVDAARRVVQDNGIRIVRDIGIAFHTHPADTFGVAFELFHKNFHAQENPTWFEPFRPIEYWRDEHPLGCTGLKRYSVAVADIDAAVAFFQDFFGATVQYEAGRPAANARAVGLTLAESTVEILTPIGPGAVQQHLGRYGDGMRSTVFAVQDLDRARRYFTERGIAPLPGDADDAFALGADDARGVIFEFSE